MKKIGIITFHSAINYGAILQAVALQKKIEQLGASCEIVNYKNLKFKRLYGFQTKFDSKNPVLKSILFIVKNMFHFIKKIKFNLFLKKNSKTSKKKYNENNISDTENIYDIFITGSDQVWNLRLTDYDKNYFLAFASDNKKYSYAASFGSSLIPKDTVTFYKKYLKGFQKISVREESGIEICKELTTTEVQTSIDPTLLFSGYEWLKMCGLDSRPKKKYILLYLVAEPLNLIQYIENKSHELGYDVIEISHKLKKTSNEFSLKRKCGPKEFINLILNAEYIATTSFHATAFSILFHKKMFVEMVDKTGKYNVRISDLFSKLKINKISNNDIWIVENNDWELTDRKISKTRDESQAYLQQIISDN